MAVCGLRCAAQLANSSHCWGHTVHVMPLCHMQLAILACACLECGVAASEGLPMHEVEWNLGVVIADVCLLLAPLQSTRALG